MSIRLSIPLVLATVAAESTQAQNDPYTTTFRAASELRIQARMVDRSSQELTGRREEI